MYSLLALKVRQISAGLFVLKSSLILGLNILLLKKKVFSWVNDIFDWVEKNTWELLVGNELPVEYRDFIKGKTKYLGVKEKKSETQEITVKNIQDNACDGFV